LSLNEKRLLVDCQHPELNIKDQCEALGISRSSFYYEPSRESDLNLLLMRKIDEIHLKIPFYGYRRMTWELREMGFEVNEKRVRRLMEKMRIITLYPKPNLSASTQRETKYPYLLRGVLIDHVNHVWSTDITYIPLSGGFVYLVAIMDWFSRRVLSWELSNTLEEDFCLEALDRALLIGKPKIFNSDQGTQFTGNRFTGRLKTDGIAISWDGKGRWADNIFIERLWRSVKYENVYPNCFGTVLEAYSSLKDYFKFYNEKRPHQSLNYNTPLRVYLNGTIKMN
jgi:putative transposase